MVGSTCAVCACPCGRARFFHSIVHFRPTDRRTNYRTDLLGVVVELQRLRLRVVGLGEQVTVFQHLCVFAPHATRVSVMKAARGTVQWQSDRTLWQLDPLVPLR